MYISRILAPFSSLKTLELSGPSLDENMIKLINCLPSSLQKISILPHAPSNLYPKPEHEILLFKKIQNAKRIVVQFGECRDFSYEREKISPTLKDWLLTPINVNKTLTAFQDTSSELLLKALPCEKMTVTIPGYGELSKETPLVIEGPFTNKDIQTGSIRLEFISAENNKFDFFASFFANTPFKYERMDKFKVTSGFSYYKKGFTLERVNKK